MKGRRTMPIPFASVFSVPMRNEDECVTWRQDMKDSIQQDVRRHRVVSHWSDVYDLEEHRL
jgi:hypothetical protein